jgi:nuclease HARBI1
LFLGDSGYTEKGILVIPFSKGQARAHPEKAEFNKIMSSCRIAVEWFFGVAENLWSYIGHQELHTILKRDVVSWFKAAILLTNIHNILYPNQISQYFDVDPPTLEEYFDSLSHSMS